MFSNNIKMYALCFVISIVKGVIKDIVDDRWLLQNVEQVENITKGR